MKRKFASVEEGIEAISTGRIVIVVDSEDRENEGDFVAAAETITPEMVHFMAKEGRGQLCMPVLPELAERLDLRLMVTGADETAPKFAVPVDHLTCETGISPWERVYTMHKMLDPTARAEDFLRPGHIFPLIARPGGVLERLGHTESAIDLARLAGLTPAGVLCEVCSRDEQHMARRDELLAIGSEFNVPVITIDALVEYRRREAGAVPAAASAQAAREALHSS